MPEVIKVTTLEPTELKATAVTLHGEIIDAAYVLTAYGHCWAKHSELGLGDHYSNHGHETKISKLSYEAENLEPGQRYYFRAYTRADDDI